MVVPRPRQQPQTEAVHSQVSLGRLTQLHVVGVRLAGEGEGETGDQAPGGESERASADPAPATHQHQTREEGAGDLPGIEPSSEILEQQDRVLAGELRQNLKRDETVQWTPRACS